MKAFRTDLDTKQVLILDALRYSLFAERQAYARLSRSLRTVERLKPKQLSEALALSTLASGWQVIDMVYRSRGLIGQVRGLSQRKPEYQAFVRGTAVVEDLRHFFQHLNTSIRSLTKESSPIMGVVTWAARDRKMSYTMAVGHWTKGMESHSLVVDTWTNEFLVGLKFNAAGTEVDLATIHAHCLRIRVFMERWLKSQGALRDDSTGASLFRFGIGAPGA